MVEGDAEFDGEPGIPTSARAIDTENRQYSAALGFQACLIECLKPATDSWRTSRAASTSRTCLSNCAESLP
jgi:hypothetical protein